MCYMDIDNPDRNFLYHCLLMKRKFKDRKIDKYEGLDLFFKEVKFLFVQSSDSES